MFWGNRYSWLRDPFGHTWTLTEIREVLSPEELDERMRGFAPAKFDCSHGDLLYLFQDAAGTPLKAIYFDNEEHVIHYDVSTPASNRVVFLSDSGVVNAGDRCAFPKRSVEQATPRGALRSG